MTRILNAAANSDGDADLEQLQAEARKQREDKLRREIEAKAKRQARNIDPVEFCLSIHDTEGADYEPAMAWEKKPATAKQLSTLRNMGIDTDKITMGYASRLLDIIFKRRDLKLATPKQLKYLRKLGHPNPETVSLAEASKFLDRHFKKKKTPEAIAA